MNKGISSNLQFSAFVNSLSIILRLGLLCYSPDGILVIKYILLTKREGHSGRISARGLDSRERSRAPRGPYKKRPSADILPVRSRVSLVNKVTRLKKVIRLKVTRLKVTRLKKAKTAKIQVRNHSEQCPVQYLEYIGPATEHFDWLISVIRPLTA